MGGGQFELALYETRTRVKIMCFEQIGVARNCQCEFPFRLVISLADRQSETARGMRFSQTALEVQRFGTVRQNALDGDLLVIVKKEKRIAIGNAGIGTSVERVELDRLRKHALGQHIVRLRPSVEELASSQVVGVSLDILGRRLRRSPSFPRAAA